MSSFTDRLRKLRKNKGDTQKQMAILLGITERHYQRYEAGTIEPNHKTTIKLAEFFNVSIDYLLGVSDDPTRH